ncbi:dienelactone hydrolase family protein [Parapedobacter indicus]|uniref:Dienelactone hydrolase family protein n=1 Tax=Parapedobacter indicus TaxID=1477437 RepID=A0A1I3K2J8_9SPHI|nr:dienelactone hydrolase family protein [Parapedobacter indicus]PPL01693.1 dienelactone hydrolase family protein [Parapedobacter indicus]SFI66741.1 Dienelactone hydrolase family protein [Parapedobacter indicus]
MWKTKSLILIVVVWVSLASIGFPQEPSESKAAPTLAGSTPLTENRDLSDLMIEGIGHYLDGALAEAADRRASLWKRDFSNQHAYEESVFANRSRLGRIIGLADSVAGNVEMAYLSTTSTPANAADNPLFTAYAVQWGVFAEIHGEGLLLQPKGPIRARVVVLPDADETPEQLIGTAPGLAPVHQYARRLAENGCQVIVPVVIDRSDEASGSRRLNRFTNQPHREWIYRQAYTFGRHIIGFEVQKVLAAVNWFEQENQKADIPIGVAGWGEGGLLAFYSAAVDTRIDAALVSGYFGKRDSLWQEPIYRNLFRLLPEFGDAEIASLIAPRKLVIDYSQSPQVLGPPPPRPGPPRLGASAAPGVLSTASYANVHDEVNRARRLAGAYGSFLALSADDGKPFSRLGESGVHLFVQQLIPGMQALQSPGEPPSEMRADFDPRQRQLRQLAEMEQFTQGLIRSSRHDRDQFFWERLSSSSPEQWGKDIQPYKHYLWNEIIGKLPDSGMPMHPKTRKILDEPKWVGYEVTLDVAPGIFVWGYYLLPKGLRPGEKRPVVVVQHGGGGLPSDVLNDEGPYNGIAKVLANSGYIVFAPHFPWRGGKAYRDLQRKANPLGLSVFSIILSQHERILDWLAIQPSTDTSRIGLYGLSWGGKVAVRVPALLDGYRLSICSGDFNEWIWKNATTDWANSYMLNPEYEMFDFNLGRTFNYGEMVALIAPRAFMVERGHDDGVGIDEMVAFEYAKVNRLYDWLRRPEMTSIAYFNGGHEINGIASCEFIAKHFKRPIYIDKTNENP